MKKAFILATILSLGVLGATTRVQAGEHSAPAMRAAQFAGHWSAMGLSPVIVELDTARNVAGHPSAQNLVLHLPDEMKMLGQKDFTLTRKSADSFESASDGPHAVFQLTSANSAMLSVTGQNGEHTELPVTRDD